jgi:hypothetical protein
MGKKEKEKKERPLDKMTTKDLRELALSIGGITGVHGLNKGELIAAIREARGEAAPKAGSKAATKAAKAVPVRELKAKLVTMRATKQELATAGDKKKVEIMRRKINRLKRQTRG